MEEEEEEEESICDYNVLSLQVGKRHLHISRTFLIKLMGALNCPRGAERTQGKGTNLTRENGSLAFNSAF